ncbi:hypothetical protein C8R46DRAFT_1215395 [Mycena filopes]|nr:hypothetical protein C8R46DRAFT_1215395 [Mycena filopes]
MWFSLHSIAASFILATIPILAAAAPTTKKACHGCHGVAGNDSASYLCHNALLGPAHLPKGKALSTIVAEYDRFGGLCPDAFLQKYLNQSNNNSYIYPPVDGFQLSTTHMPIEGNQTLAAGMLLDRFGSEYGRYLAPAYTPYGQRALPPTNLNDAAANYHVYRAEKPFTVLTGTIAAWFEQPGQGTQYLAGMNVMMLVEEGFLTRI